MLRRSVVGKGLEVFARVTGRRSSARAQNLSVSPCPESGGGQPARRGHQQSFTPRWVTRQQDLTPWPPRSAPCLGIPIAL